MVVEEDSTEFSGKVDPQWCYTKHVMMYIDYVLRNYAEENIVFDGYESF